MKQEGKEGRNECRLPAPAGYRCIRLVRWYLDRIRKDTRPVFRNAVKMNTCVPDLVPEMFVPDVPFKSLKDTGRNGKEHVLQKRTSAQRSGFFCFRQTCSSGQMSFPMANKAEQDNRKTDCIKKQEKNKMI